MSPLHLLSSSLSAPLPFCPPAPPPGLPLTAPPPLASLSPPPRQIKPNATFLCRLEHVDANDKPWATQRHAAWNGGTRLSPQKVTNPSSHSLSYPFIKPLALTPHKKGQDPLRQLVLRGGWAGGGLARLDTGEDLPSRRAHRSACAGLAASLGP